MSVIIKGYWESSKGADRILLALGYNLSESDHGYWTIHVSKEHMKFFEYTPGTPICAGVLAYIGGAEKIASDNLKKIRRRVEDRLRKADQYEILRCAHYLGVKLAD